MTTTFKRVISHPDELGNLAKKTTMQDDAKEFAIEDDRKMPASTTIAAAPTAVVEVDNPRENEKVEFAIEDDRKMPASCTTIAAALPAVVEVDNPWENENVVHVRFQEASSNHSYSSSLSGSSSCLLRDSYAEVIALNDLRNETHLPRVDVIALDDLRNETHLPRVDSTKSVGSGSGSGSWGQFLDLHETSRTIDISHQTVDYETGTAHITMAPPNEVLEESPSALQLWRHAAGNRPPQPEEDRAHFEMLWRQNFQMSQVNYHVPKEVLMAGTSISSCACADNHFAGDSRELSNYGNLATYSIATNAEVAEAIERLHRRREGPQCVPHEVVNKQVKGSGSKENLMVLIRGDNEFGTTVSKSFDRENELGDKENVTVNISIASYRVVESKKDGAYAQFLVIYREGSVQDTIGVWKRYSDFEALSDKVTQSQDSCTSVLANMSPLAVTREVQDVEDLPNAVTSWHLFKKKKRWYRCLDAGYLSLKVFLLERFLHDILFESSSPNLLHDFVNYDTSK